MPNMFNNPSFQMYGGPMVSTTSGLRSDTTGGSAFSTPTPTSKKKRPVIGQGTQGQPSQDASGDGTPVISPKPDEFQGKLAEAMIGQYGQRLPQSRTPWEAIGQGMPYMAAHYRQKQQADAKQARNKQIADMISGADSSSDLVNALIKSGDPDYMKLGVQQRIAASQPKGNVKLGPGDTLYDQDTQEAVFTAPAKRDDAEVQTNRLYKQYFREERQAGRQPLPKTAWEKGLETRAKEEAKGEVEQPEKQSKALSSLRSLENQHEIVEESIDKALSDYLEGGVIPETGFWSMASAIPGTSAYDLSTILETVKANLGFDKLQEMRENSPTGGALGQVTEKELNFLQSVKGSLDQGQSEEQLTANLKRIRQGLQELRDQRREAYRRDFGELPDGFDKTDQSQRGQQGPQVGQEIDETQLQQLPEGTVIRGEDGRRYRVQDGQLIPAE